LCPHAGTHYLVERKLERHFLLRVKCLVHDLQTLPAIQRVSGHAKHFEVIQDVCLDPLQLRLCLPDIFRFHAKGNVLRPHQAVIAFGKLIFQHLCVFHAHMIKSVMPGLDLDDRFKFLHVAVVVDERQLEMDTAVKVIEEITPVFKNSIFVLILCQLIVNVVKTDGFGIIFILHPADSIPCHFPVGNGLLGGQTLLLCLFICFLLCPVHGTTHSFLAGSMFRIGLSRSLDTPLNGCAFLSLRRLAFLSFFCFLPCLRIPCCLLFCCFLCFFLLAGQPAVLPLSPLIA